MLSQVISGYRERREIRREGGRGRGIAREVERYREGGRERQKDCGESRFTPSLP